MLEEPFWLSYHFCTLLPRLVLLLVFFVVGRRHCPVFIRTGDANCSDHFAANS